MRDFQLMTVSDFMRSYDRDYLELQEDPDDCIREVEADMEKAYRLPYGFDHDGNKLWSVADLKALQSIEGDPLWPEEPLPVAI